MGMLVCSNASAQLCGHSKGILPFFVQERTLRVSFLVVAFAVAEELVVGRLFGPVSFVFHTA